MNKEITPDMMVSKTLKRHVVPKVRTSCKDSWDERKERLIKTFLGAIQNTSEDYTFGELVDIMNNESKLNSFVEKMEDSDAVVYADSVDNYTIEETREVASCIENILK